MLNRHCLIVLLICALASLSARCKQDEQVPEHVLQKRRQEAQAAAARGELKAAQQSVQEARTEVQQAERLWSPGVRRAVEQVYRARGRGSLQALQALTFLGLPAASALEQIAKSRTLHPQTSAYAALMLVELQLFRPAELAKLGRRRELPHAQQAAIEALGRLGNPRAERLLAGLATALQDPHPSRQPAAGAGPALPLFKREEVLKRARDRSRKWWYSDAQLAALDRIVQADDPAKLQLALAAARQLALERGLDTILRSPATRPPIKAAVAEAVVERSRTSPGTLLTYCAPQQPPLLRLAAARQLLLGGRPADRSFLRKLAATPDEPLAPLIGRLLQGGQGVLAPTK